MKDMKASLRGMVYAEGNICNGRVVWKEGQRAFSLFVFHLGQHDCLVVVHLYVAAWEKTKKYSRGTPGMIVY